jgi:hypothetical protein
MMAAMLRSQDAKTFPKGSAVFLTAYVALILFAAFPLVRTLLTGGRAGLPVVWLHRLYRDLGDVAAAVLLIICFETALTISLQNC